MIRALDEFEKQRVSAHDDARSVEEDDGARTRTAETVERSVDLPADEGADVTTVDASQDLTRKVAERERVVAVSRARLPIRS